MTKRVMALLLAMVMLFTMVPMPAAAAATGTVTFRVVDADGYPITGIKMELKRTIPNQSNSRTTIASGITNDAGIATVQIPASANLQKGHILDCDPSQEYASKYTWDWKAPGIVRTAVLAEDSGVAIDPKYNSTEKEDYHNVTVQRSSGNINFEFKLVLTDPTPKHTITWLVDGETTTCDVKEGVAPRYPGELPSKVGHTFVGWDKEVAAVTAPVTYTAVFEPEKYLITWMNGTEELQSGEVEYGETPVYSGAAPVKAADAQYTYTFKGWDKEISAVSGEATYNAVFEETLNKYTITWKNDDKVLKEEEVEYGVTPAYTGEAPVKAADAQYTYTFENKWDKDIVPVTGPAEYTAVFAETLNQYEIKWVNGEEQLLSGKVEYGATPEYKGATPVKAKDKYNTYTFKGWDPAVTEVTGEATYRAVFEPTKRTYTVLWKDGGQTLGEIKNVEYCEQYEYPGVGNPVKAGLTFIGWEAPEVNDNLSTIVYKAIFAEATYNAEVTVDVGISGVKMDLRKRVNGGSTVVIDTQTSDEDGKIVFNVEGLKKDDILDIDPNDDMNNRYDWNSGTEYVRSIVEGFSGISVMDRTDNPTMKCQDAVILGNGDAKFTFTLRLKDTWPVVTWKNEDGEVLAEGRVAPGTTPVYAGETPVKQETAQYSYQHDGWTPAPAAVSKDTVYTAKFAETVKTYTITWKNEDGTVLDTDTVEYGAKPEYNGETPVKEGNAEFSYTFDGWDTVVAEVTGDATYVAKFKATTNKYTITWKNGETVLKTEELNYGATPAYDGATPAKDQTASKKFTFAGWNPVIAAVSGDQTYTANFTEEARQYTIIWMDGNVKLDEKSGEYADTHAYTGEEPSKVGKNFVGFGNRNVDDANSTITYYAQYVDVTAVNGTVTVHVGHENVTMILRKRVPGGTPVEIERKTSDENGSIVFDVRGLDKGVILDINPVDTVRYDWDWGTEPVRTVAAGYTGVTVLNLKENNTTKCWQDAQVSGDADVKFTFVLKLVDKTPDHTITWVVDGVETKATVAHNALPVFDGTPSMDTDAQYTYAFEKWEPAVVEATEDATYTAKFTATEREYTIFWMNGEEVLKSEEGTYGTSHQFTGTEPVKEGWNFTGWSTAEIDDENSEIVYYAQFEEADPVGGKVTVHVGLSNVQMNLRKRTSGGKPVVIANKTSDENGMIEFTGLKDLKKDEILDIDPVDTARYVWNWAASPVRTVGTGASGVVAKNLNDSNGSWQDAVVTGNGDVAFAFILKLVDKTPNHTITWVVDGVETKATVAHDALPVFDGTPTKEATAQHTYTFEKWEPAVVKATEDATYTAKFTEALRKYTITWKVEGFADATAEFDYGTMPAYQGTPVKAAANGYTYTFAGWTPALAEVTGNATYTARFDAVCSHEKDFFGICEEAECDHGSNCTCNPDVTDGARYVNIITKDGEWHRLGNVPVVLMMNPNKAGQDHVELWRGVTAESGEIAVPAAKLEDVLPGSSLYACVDTNNSGFEWAYEIGGETPVRLVSGGALLVNAGLNKDDDGNESAWIQAEEGVGFKVEFTLFAEVVEEEEEDQEPVGDDKVTIYTGWTDMEMSLRKRNSVEGLVEIATGMTDDEGKVVFSGLNLKKGDILDCDPVDSRFVWEWENSPVRVVQEGAVGVEAVDLDNDEGSWQDAKVTTDGAVEFTFILNLLDTIPHYTITWKNGDEVLETDVVEEGETPEYNGATPTKESSDETYYVFAGWEPEVKAADADAVYQAKFDEADRLYTVTWKVVGEEDLVTEWEYGDMPYYSEDDEDPVKEDENGFSYTFQGWDPEVTEVTADAVYTAVFEATCNHEKDFFGICKDTDCTHSNSCICNPDVAEGVRTVNIITKDGSWNRIGNVPVVLMMNPNKAGQDHVELWRGVTNANGDVAVSAEALENVLPGSSLYCYVGEDSGFDWAYEIDETPVRLVSGGDKLVNTGITKDKDGNEYAWVTAENGVGFNAEFTLFVKVAEEEEETEGVRANIRLEVYDLNNKTVPVPGIKFEIKAKNGTANEGQTPDAHGRTTIGYATTDANGAAVLSIADIESFAYTFLNGTVIDCDLVGENYYWDPALTTTGGSRILKEGAAGVVRDTNPNHAAKVTAAGAADGFDFTFICYVANKGQTYTVAFDANGGRGNMADQVIPRDAEIALKANTFTKNGNEFAGWELVGTENTYADKGTVYNLAETNGKVTMKAIWTPNTYEIRFDANGGEVETTKKTVTYGEAIGALPEAARQDYTFDGWYSSRVGGVKITERTLFSAKGDIVLYAHWTPVPVAPAPGGGGGSTVINRYENNNLQGNGQNASGSSKYNLDTTKASHITVDGKPGMVRPLPMGETVSLLIQATYANMPEHIYVQIRENGNYMLSTAKNALGGVINSDGGITYNTETQILTIPASLVTGDVYIYTDFWN